MKTKISFFLLLLLSTLSLRGEDTIFWWEPKVGPPNFGDYLSKVIVEKILGREVTLRIPKLNDPKLLFAIGSCLHYARSDDVVWGSGFRENPVQESGRFTALDVRAVRGPRTRAYLVKMGIKCPTVYGDPAILMAELFPELEKSEQPKYEYVIIPTYGERDLFKGYKNVVLPTEPWNEVVERILDSRLVIASSLHALIVAESFGVPARMLKMTWFEPMLKYQDYYESTGRPDFTYATSVQQALLMGGEKPGQIDTQPLLKAFPWNYFNAN